MEESYYYILSILFFSLASICNAMMDTLQFHWSTFRWKDKVNDHFFNPSISWRNKYVDGDPDKGFIFKFPFGFISNFLDAWHLLKSTSIFLIVFSIVCFDFHNSFFFENYYLNQFTWIGIFGLSWILPFNLFFNKILVIKKK